MSNVTCHMSVSLDGFKPAKLDGEPPVTRHAAMVMRRDCTLIGDKAKVQLSYAPVIGREAGLAAMRSV